MRKREQLKHNLTYTSNNDYTTKQQSVSHRKVKKTFHVKHISQKKAQKRFT